MSTHLCKRLFSSSVMPDCEPIPLGELAPRLVGKSLLYHDYDGNIHKVKVKKHIHEDYTDAFVTNLKPEPCYAGYSEDLVYIKNNELLFYDEECNIHARWNFL